MQIGAEPHFLYKKVKVSVSFDEEFQGLLLFPNRDFALISLPFSNKITQGLESLVSPPPTVCAEVFLNSTDGCYPKRRRSMQAN